MAKRARITGPGIVLNRHAKKGRLEIAFDPSPDGFITDCRKENGRLKVLIVADEVDPIEISTQAKAWVMKFEDAAVPARRLADLEALITEEQPVHIVIEYQSDQEKLPFSDTRSGRTEDFAEDPPTSVPTQTLELKLPRRLAAAVKVRVACDEAGQWFGTLAVRIPHADTTLAVTGAEAEANTHAAVLDRLTSDCGKWLEQQAHYQDRAILLDSKIKALVSLWKPKTEQEPPV